MTSGVIFICCAYS